MCGRTCLTLEPEDLKCACKYKKAMEAEDDGEVDETVPQYRTEYNLGMIMSKLNFLEISRKLDLMVLLQNLRIICHLVKSAQSLSQRNILIMPQMHLTAF